MCLCMIQSKNEGIRAADSNSRNNIVQFDVTMMMMTYDDINGHHSRLNDLALNLEWTCIKKLMKDNASSRNESVHHRNLLNVDVSSMDQVAGYVENGCLPKHTLHVGIFKLLPQKLQEFHCQPLQ